MKFYTDNLLKNHFRFYPRYQPTVSKPKHSIRTRFGWEVRLGFVNNSYKKLFVIVYNNIGSILIIKCLYNVNNILFLKQINPYDFICFLFFKIINLLFIFYNFIINEEYCNKYYYNYYYDTNNFIIKTNIAPLQPSRRHYFRLPPM